MTGVSIDTRERILTVALEVFSQNGFDGGTTREIARQAEVNLGLIQYYFGSKEKLWQAAMDRIFGEVFALLKATDRSDTRETAEALLRASATFAAANPAFIRIMNDECKRDSPRMHWLVDRHGKPMFDKVIALFDDARRAGVVPDVPPLHLYYLFVGAVGMIFSQAPECKRMTGLDPSTDPAVIGAHADALIALFLR